MSIIDELKAQVNQLQDEVNGKNLELLLLETEMVVVLEPSVALSQTTQLLLQMIAELSAYEAKNKPTAKTKASRDRLNRLFELNKVLDRIATDNYKLKMANRQIHAQYQLLRINNMKLQTKLQTIEKTYAEL